MRHKLTHTLVRCVECRRPTTWHHAWKHEGRCLSCVDPKLAAKLADERRARILERTREGETHE